MEKTNKKSITIGKLIEDLERHKTELGEGAEVFMVNEAEGCFDGILNTFQVQTARGDVKVVALMRSDLALKIRG